MLRKKKFLAVLLCMLLIATTSAGCTSLEGEVSESDSLSEVSIEEQLVFDKDDIKITATGLEKGVLGPELKLLIENNSSKDITVQSRNASINGIMVEPTMSAQVAPGKKANDSLTFGTSELDECGIEQIATMEFYFTIFDTDSWDNIVDSDKIKIDTSAVDDYEQKYDDSGNVLVEKDGIKIIEKGLSKDGSFWGPGVILYIENNSDKDITVQVRDVSVNGFMVDSSMSEDVAAGKRALSAVQFFSTDLEENSITDITSAEFSFHVFTQKGWDDIFDTDVIKINY